MKKHIITVAATAGLLFTAFGSSASAHGDTYTVRTGDCLSKIAKENHVSVTQLKVWNHLSSDRIKINQKLSLIAPHSYVLKKVKPVAIAKKVEPTTIANTANQTYKVRTGDSLSLIAKEYSTTVSTLKSLNNLKTDTIKIGQVLKVKGTATKVTASSVSVPSKKVVATLVSAPAKPAYATLLGAPESKAQAVIAEAKKYSGTRYVWGGITPSGFDCSGFIYYVFNNVGVSLPRTVASQWAATESVGFPNPGDLVFFETYKKGPSHVGIYIGGNQFIHSSSHGVRIDNMTSSYWESKYIGARAVF
ncbi:MAG: NlpC/P60 family protein [Bacillota bacterium]|nr:NlpC/P60 family protein [Bacillota bacterium]